MDQRRGQRRRFLRHGLGLAAAAPLAGAWGRVVRAAAAPATAPVDARGSVLAPLLASNREKHPGSRLSNHLSMALLSLAALGGTPEQLKAMAEPRLRRLRDFPGGGPAVTAQTWRRFLGDEEALPGLRGLFTEEIARRGVAGTLRHYLPDLLPGVGAHAFHAVIRTGYGVRFADPAEVAMGLAYWAVTFLPLGPLGPAAHALPEGALAAVQATAALTPEGRRRTGVEKPGGLNIAEQMRWACTLPGFGAAASALRIDDGTGVRSLDAIARAMVRLHVASRDNFTALHAVTGTHAYRMLEPFVADRALGRRHLWQALVAAYVSIGTPRLAMPAAVALPTWTEIVARAAASTDDHQLKLTDVAREEWRRSGDDTYRWSAAIHLDLA